MTPRRSRPVEALRKLMLEHGLTQRNVAEICCVSLKTVESWMADPESANHRRMPERHLVIIRMILPGWLDDRRAIKRRQTPT